MLALVMVSRGVKTKKKARDILKNNNENISLFTAIFWHLFVDIKSNSSA